ncbi:hypothetical protein [Rhodopirellula sp. MGV]|uniref:hypothetical protein n=1 Tax=Rhodopirellula sp. MGV TaxID=2023130 RepID=UPI000B979AE6|nr:hypothetical protein [Rhodopirellula sp. MGV]OYP38902.1 hypothetical protein CGZ80_01395 [Rhodopirellula sp. MGV]PNY38284.1 hypothetical protein C2E31_02940 [Rhodopirellula baltica]
MAKQPTAPKPVSRMALVEYSNHQKILAGHDPTNKTVFVLRKTDAGEWYLYQIELTALDEGLRSFLSADESEHDELHKAILATMPRPKRAPKRKRAAR